MKIGIITFHFPYNCGAVLQCYALQHCLKQQGHEVSVINYRLWYHQNRYTPLKNPFQVINTRLRTMPENVGLLRKIKAVAGAFYRTVGYWMRYPENKKQDDLFRLFTDTYLHETRVFRSLKQLQRFCPVCDAYITGSDQLWNAYLTNGDLDPAYFLKFGKEDAVRIAYAVGADFDTVKQIDQILPPLLQGMDAIALRETKCLEKVCQSAPDIPVTTVIDPTLLLDKEAYHEIEPEKPLEEEPVIFTYTMPNETQKTVYQAALQLAEKLNIKVIDASGQPSLAHHAIADHRTCSPAEFLWYMNHARYVLTNSFHGTAFSVIMEKQFFVIPHSKTGNRAVDMLGRIGLEHRWTATAEEAVASILSPIDYEAVREKRQQLRRDALSYMTMCFNIIKTPLRR